MACMRETGTKQRLEHQANMGCPLQPRTHVPRALIVVHHILVIPSHQGGCGQQGRGGGPAQDNHGARRATEGGGEHVVLGRVTGTVVLYHGLPHFFRFFATAVCSQSTCVAVTMSKIVLGACAAWLCTASIDRSVGSLRCVLATRDTGSATVEDGGKPVVFCFFPRRVPPQTFLFGVHCPPAHVCVQAPACPASGASPSLHSWAP